MNFQSPRYRRIKECTWGSSLFCWSLFIGVCIFIIVQAAGSDFRYADRPWSWNFPYDHGNHSAFKTEWWYLAGNVKDIEGREFGYQLTFFRHALIPESNENDSVWAVRDIYFAHFVLTDIKANRVYLYEKVSRAGPGLAGIDPDRLHIWIHDWALEGGAVWKIQARADGHRIQFELEPPSEILLHGEEGRSVKGLMLNQASYYYSFPRIATQGSLTLDGQTFRVSGSTWFDHEFSSNQLSKELIGWDWFGLHLGNSSELMIYLMRRPDNSFACYSGGTLNRRGRRILLKGSDIEAIPVRYWTSSATKTQYPVEWRIKIARAALDITVRARVENCELQTFSSTQIIYWEGPVEVQGTLGSSHISSLGYMELTGYTHSMWGKT